MGTSENKKSNLLAKIETKDDAIKTIKEASLVFFVLAGILVILDYFITQHLITEAIVYAILAGILLK